MCKHTNFESGTKAPLLIAPMLSAHEYDSSRGKSHYGPVELIDLMPTLASMFNLGTPSSSNNWTPWEGVDLTPVLRNPALPSVKYGAQSQYFRGAGSSKYWGKFSVHKEPLPAPVHTELLSRSRREELTRRTCVHISHE